MDKVNSMLQQLVFYSRGLDALRRHPSSSSSRCVSELQGLEAHLVRAHGVPTAEAVLELVAVHVAGCCSPEDLAAVAGVADRMAALVVENLPQRLQLPMAHLLQVCSSGCFWQCQLGPATARLLLYCVHKFAFTLHALELPDTNAQIKSLPTSGTKCTACCVMIHDLRPGLCCAQGLTSSVAVALLTCPNPCMFRGTCAPDVCS